MKTFDTFEKLDGMLPCKKKPIIVHTIQINEPFRVNSLEGDYKQGKAGDYLMRGIDGELYICDKDIFERSYDIIGQVDLSKFVGKTVKCTFADRPPIEGEVKDFGFVDNDYYYYQIDGQPMMQNGKGFYTGQILTIEEV
jgi:hypothetical protein